MCVYIYIHIHIYTHDYIDLKQNLVIFPLKFDSINLHNLQLSSFHKSCRE